LGLPNQRKEERKNALPYYCTPKVLEKIPGQLEASFLIFLTLGSIKQSNTHHLRPFLMYFECCAANKNSVVTIMARTREKKN